MFNHKESTTVCLCVCVCVCVCVCHVVQGHYQHADHEQVTNGVLKLTDHCDVTASLFSASLTLHASIALPLLYFLFPPPSCFLFSILLFCLLFSFLPINSLLFSYTSSFICISPLFVFHSVLSLLFPFPPFFASHHILFPLSVPYNPFTYLLVLPHLSILPFPLLLHYHPLPSSLLFLPVPSPLLNIPLPLPLHLYLVTPKTPYFSSIATNLLSPF